MNRKQLLLILAVGVVVVGLGLWLRKSDVSSYRTTQGRMGQKVLGEFDVNTVAQVLIRHTTNEVNLAKQNDLWTVKERGGYPANFSELGEFLRKAAELKVVQPVTVGASRLPQLELVAPSAATNTGTLVELKDKAGKTIKTVLLGKKHMRAPASPSGFGGDEGWPDGRYVMVDNKTDSVSLVSETFSNIEPKPEQWLNKDFFKVEKVKAVSVTFPVATNSWKLSRETETGELKLADAKPDEKLDSAKTSGIPTALSYASFVDVVADPKPEQTGLDKATVAVLETFEDFAYKVKVGGKSGEDNYYLAVEVSATIPKERAPGKDEKPEDKDKLDKEFKEKVQRLSDKFKQEKAYEKSVYLVSKWTVDSLLKERHTLLAEKKEEKKDEPAKASSGASSNDLANPAAAAGLTPAKVELMPPPAPRARTNPPGTTLPPLPPTLKLEPPAKKEGDQEAPKP